ncbi:hypothetical protein CsSME_00039137 [Camellia sinensis var. sinensis]
MEPEKNMTENGEDQEKKELQNNKKKKKLGGMRTMPFILAVPWFYRRGVRIFVF